MRAELVVESLPHDAGLDGHRVSVWIDPTHPIHAAHVDDQPAVQRNGAAVAGGRFRARGKRNAVARGPANELDQLGFGFRLHDRVGHGVTRQRADPSRQDTDVVSIQTSLGRVERDALPEHRLQFLATTRRQLVHAPYNSIVRATRILVSVTRANAQIVQCDLAERTICGIGMLRCARALLRLCVRGRVVWLRAVATTTQRVRRSRFVRPRARDKPWRAYSSVVDTAMFHR